MAYVKIFKNRAYFKRFQVKYRRRREGKTDYYARKRLVQQDKNKYSSPKYRLVVRATSTRIICQIVSSTIIGDKIHASADSSELKHFGIQTGLTNYAAAYCTGLLVARRILLKLGLDSQFAATEATGEDYHIEEQDCERRPFKALLDVGITITTTGNRVFGAMKGACDGGLHIPHSEKRFPGYTKDGDECSYDSKVHSDRIMGVHVANYMRYLQEEDPDKYKKHFSQYIKNGVDPDKIESLYRAAHDKIKKDPIVPKKTRKYPSKNVIQGNTVKTYSKTYPRHRKLTKEQRNERLKMKMQMCLEAEQAAA
ncbi:large subunit ribosomal protein L5e [Babesia microti strain RI]|uniref:Large subunit ribosomal protein L5e n=1 Tax=Babesia microti (strain RI) TaxID=1133968 RepID=A0A1N6LWW2_BABMR|nr:large subunit ribosomal protein L5e [Babesia microti strain RI]SIO73357.1 large subunit ribosomal protein L5e [Babesia microti strain RI]|eukprot:XP_021337459.1 large subunit ribosomal protein L5e [Babesia microti strain RI]